MKDGGAVFAADAAARTLKHFEDYFGIDYELPKIDSAAIPDFAAGAMENWVLSNRCKKIASS
jgi:aminopeptidase N